MKYKCSINSHVVDIFPYAELNRKSDVCELCEEYTVEELDYLNDKENQREIFYPLHNTCNNMLSFKQQASYSQLLRKLTLISNYAL